MSRIRKGNGTTDHQHIQERLSAYLDGELSPQEHRAVRQHLDACQSCLWHLDTLQQTVRWTRALPTVPTPRVFTIPAPARPVPAPRRGWGFVPLLQGATALVALLLVVMLAGDVLLISLAPASAPQPAVMLEQAPAPIQLTTVVQEREEAVAEVEAVVEEVMPPPTPSALPEVGALTEAPAEEPLSELAEERPQAEGEQAEKAAVVATAFPEEAPARAMAAEPPGKEEGDAAVPPEAAPAPGTPMPEATIWDAEGAAAAEVLPTPTTEPTPLPTEPPTVMAPTELPTPVAPTEAPTTAAAPTTVAEAKAPAPVVADEWAGRPAGALQQPAVGWLRLVEVGLAVLLVFLGSFTIVSMILRRRVR